MLCAVRTRDLLPASCKNFEMIWDTVAGCMRLTYPSELVESWLAQSFSRLVNALGTVLMLLSTLCLASVPFGQDPNFAITLASVP